MGRVGQVIDRDIEAGHAVARWLADHPVVWAAGAISELADQPPLATINVATIAVGAINRDRRLLRTGIRMAAAHVLATGAKAIIKRNVDRARPNLFSDRDDHTPTPGDDREGPRNSFPSGHTAGAVAVARAVAREYPERCRAAYVAAGAAAVVQVPRGQHFPIDVAVGAAIGVAAEWLVARVLPPAEPERRLRRADIAAVRAFTPD